MKELNDIELSEVSGGSSRELWFYRACGLPLLLIGVNTMVSGLKNNSKEGIMRKIFRIAFCSNMFFNGIETILTNQNLYESKCREVDNRIEELRIDINRMQNDARGNW